MESDADDDMSMSHAVGSSALHHSDHDFPSTVVNSSVPQTRFRPNHFSPLSAEIDDEPLSTTVGDAPLRRRLTLVGVARGGDSEQRVGGDRDPRCGDFLEGPHSGISDVEGMLDPVVGQGETDVNVDDCRMTPVIREALVSLDVDLLRMFSRRTILMKCPPQFLRGTYKSALRMTLIEVQEAAQSRDET